MSVGDVLNRFPVAIKDPRLSFAVGGKLTALGPLDRSLSCAMHIVSEVKGNDNDSLGRLSLMGSLWDSIMLEVIL